MSGADGKDKAAASMARKRWAGASAKERAAHGRLMIAARNAKPDVSKPVLDVAGLVQTFGRSVNFFRTAIRTKRLPAIRRPGGSKDWVYLDVAARYLQTLSIQGAKGPQRTHKRRG